MHFSWYESVASIEYPSMNKDLEPTNLVIKEENTLKERFPVRQYFNCIGDLVSSSDS